MVQRLFGDVVATDSGETFVDGGTGVPTYAEGPNDRSGQVRKITETLERAHGSDGWNVLSDTSPMSPWAD